MKSKHDLTFDIILNIDVNTVECCSRLIQTAMEVLLFQRNQIPFCYDMFRSIVGKITSGQITETEQPEWNNYQLVKQRESAKSTLEMIQQLFKEISNALQQSKRRVQVMILFGSTVYTAKEAFLINLPKINRNHYPQHHRQALESALKQLAMKMTLSNELQSSGKVTGPTNTFLLLGTISSDTEQENACEDCALQLMERYKLPANCQKYILNISHHPESGTYTYCCKEMEVFNDLVHRLEIEADSSKLIDEIEKNDATDYLVESDIVWYQIGKELKGYKDVLVKGKSIWDSAQ